MRYGRITFWQWKMAIEVVLFVALWSIAWSRYVSDVYPTSIPKYDIRIDFYSNKTVQSGLLHSLPPKNTLNEFNRYLQCSRTQPDFNYNNGVISMLRMFPLSTDTIKLFCAFIESKCQNTEACHSEKTNFEAGNYPKNENFNYLTPWARAHLYRVIDGKLKLDWPWGMDRFEKYEKISKSLFDTEAALAKMTLDRITDMRDSVFFTGGDTPSVPFDKPLPIFSDATSDPYADMVWPWYAMWQDANQAYKKIRAANLQFTEAAFEQTEEGYRSWEHKVPKAAYFATNQGPIRQFMFEVARLNPDLMDAKFIEDLIRNWNPSSREDELSNDEKKALAHNATAVAAAQSLPAGYGIALANLSALGGYTRYHAGSYKYVVVPLSDGLSTSGRLQHLLSHSGAVVMIQRSRTKFHISAGFRPWVHYVPVSYTGADIAEKIRWLREHDDMARQIAENGRNFARSHLRLEDYYCYAASALDMMAELTSETEAAKTTFSPTDITAFSVIFSDTAAYEFPV